MSSFTSIDLDRGAILTGLSCRGALRPGSGNLPSGQPRVVSMHLDPVGVRVLDADDALEFVYGISGTTLSAFLQSRLPCLSRGNGVQMLKFCAPLVMLETVSTGMDGDLWASMKETLARWKESGATLFELSGVYIPPAVSH